MTAVTDAMIEAGCDKLHDEIDLSEELLADLADDMPRVVEAIYRKMHAASPANAAPDEDAEWLLEQAKLPKYGPQAIVNFKRIASRLATAPTPREPDDAEWRETLEDIRFGLEFAYKQGLHEFGYDPVERIDAMLAASPRSDVLREALDEVREYFDQRADAECDPSGPGYTGNEEMRLLVMIDAALASTGKTGGEG